MKTFLLIVIAFAGPAALLAVAAPASAGGTNPHESAGDLVSRLLQPGNLAASSLLAFNVIAFIKGWIVPAWVYDAEKKRADRMEERAWRNAEYLTRAVESTEKTAQAVLTQKQGTQ